MRTVEIKVYKINEHPNRQLCYDWIRDNWHDLNQHSVDEIVKSIEALSREIGGTNDYCISQVPDRGEHITFKGYDKGALKQLNADDLPLTGVCWDAFLIEGLQKGNPSKVLEVLHRDTEYEYSDEGLFEFCEANEYEFDENGEFFS